MIRMQRIIGLGVLGLALALVAGVGCDKKDEETAPLIPTQATGQPAVTSGGATPPAGDPGAQGTPSPGQAAPGTKAGGQTVLTPDAPAMPTGFPTAMPSGFPTALPSGFPSTMPSGFPTAMPSVITIPSSIPIPPITIPSANKP